jgi:hypothetical protein
MSEAPLRDREEENSPEADKATDGTLGGYFSFHSRPPGFEGLDGCPYTVSIEVEKTPNLDTPYSGYLVFPRWADTGAGIVGHLETPLIRHGKSEEEVRGRMEALTLQEVNDLLRDAILSPPTETE